MGAKKLINDAQLTFLLPGKLKRNFMEKMNSIQSIPSIYLRKFVEEIVKEDETSNSKNVSDGK